MMESVYQYFDGIKEDGLDCESHWESWSFIDLNYAAMAVSVGC